jgi:hypothetical protein
MAHSITVRGVSAGTDTTTIPVAILEQQQQQQQQEGTSYIREQQDEDDPVEQPDDGLFDELVTGRAAHTAYVHPVRDPSHLTPSERARR